MRPLSGKYARGVSVRPSDGMNEAIAMVAPGQALRDGLDRILRAKRGGLVVVGDGPEVLSICSGGFLLDSEFSPQRLSELAKMDGAIIVAPDASRIARANVHLMPDASIPTSETGTRHRTAERVARSIDVPVMAVSAAMSVIAVFRGTGKHTVQPSGWLHDRTDQALATMQRFRNRFDAAVSNLSMLEIEDAVSVGDVVGVVQAAEMVLRIAEEVEGYLIELGEDGRLVGLQSAEMIEGVAVTLHLVVRDYCFVGKNDTQDRHTTARRIIDELASLPSDELRDPDRVAKALRLADAQLDVESGVEPRGYRLLSRLPRLPDTIIDRIVDRFGSLQAVMRASLTSLEEVDGVGQTRASAVRDGLSRLAEASIFERYQ